MSSYRLLLLVLLLASCSGKKDVAPSSYSSPYLGFYSGQYTKTTIIGGAAPKTIIGGGYESIGPEPYGDPKRLIIYADTARMIILGESVNGGTNFTLIPSLPANDPKATSLSSGYLSLTGFSFSQTIISPANNFTQTITSVGKR
ncbi:hypothetical protein GO755_38445 [Spirosoma sp. HMF4905]|uniref:Uncharacterized protein n=1 Tax=Spirosoma arboris TaxID=2682092 RepID=A0A7K1SQA1_9BACT|nr:hypothetical protein [Spirosoma arboris]MVM35957.1 hypothetical protein [Spirosoma arboris]